VPASLRRGLPSTIAPDAGRSIALALGVERSHSVSKKGKGFERVVAEVVKAMDPWATVRQGEWVVGPDGRREMDVVVSGTADGQERTVLIECKDFHPRRTGPVGIGYVDALESKRHDVRVDVALMCSNAGFTKDAIRKAKRVGIGLISVMRKGDKRIRFLVPEELYTRRIKVENLTIGLCRGDSPIQLDEAPFEAILYEGNPIGNWVIRRVMLLLGANPIVKGSYTATHRLIMPLMLELPGGPVLVDKIDYHLRISGGWFAQQVTFDASAGLYDWLRRRVRLAPGPGQFHINNVDVNAGDPIKRPPDHILSETTDVCDGEITFRLLAVDGLDAREPVPEIDRFVRSKDLEIVMKDVPNDAYTSGRI
jgi:hypothetical protein